MNDDGVTSQDTERRGWGAALVIAILGLAVLVLATALSAASVQAGPSQASGNAKQPGSLAWRVYPPFTNTNLLSVYMVSANDGWLVGNSGAAFHYDGTGWSQVSISTTDNLWDVYMLSSTNGYILSDQGKIFHYDGANWTQVYDAHITLTRIAAADRNNPDDVWVCGISGRIYHWNGTSWSLAWTEPQQKNFFAIQMTSATEGWATGQLGEIAHYLNGTWSDYTPPAISDTLYDLFFRAPDDGWSVGFTSTTYVMHYDGVQWARAYTLTFPLDRIFTLSTTDGWATGPSTIAHYDGTGFTQVQNPANGLLRSVYMVSPTDGWIVGYGGTVLRYSDNATPTPLATSTSTPSATPTTCAMSFTDVSSSDWFYNYVLYLYCHGVVGGYDTTPPCAPGQTPCFNPGGTTTRGQLSKIAVLGFNVPTNTSGGPHFSDVGPGSAFYDYVETLYNLGAISGYDDGTFRPNNYVTRGQLAKILVNTAVLLGLPGWQLENPADSTFEDVTYGSSFYRYVETAYSHGIIGGYPCGQPPAGECVPPSNKPYFLPGNNATRAQISKIEYLAVTSP